MKNRKIIKKSLQGILKVNVKGIAVYEAADDKQKLTYLPPKTTFELDGEENGYAKIRKINDCDVPNLLVKENGSTDPPHKGLILAKILDSAHLYHFFILVILLFILFR